MSHNNQTIWSTLAQAISGKETNLEGFDDETIIDNVNLNGIGPLLDHHVHLGTIGGLSDTVCSHFRQESRAQATFTLLLDDSTRKILDLLDQHKIPVLLLKGTPVAHLYYENPYQRSRCDTDIYIGEEHTKISAELLASRGYMVSGLETRKHSSKQFVAAKIALKDILMHFDVHFKLSNRVMFRSSLPFEDCYKNRQAVTALGPNAYALSPVDLLLHACIHRIAHGRNTERNRLIWLYDIHLLVESMDEAELTRFREKALQRSIGVLCADALEVSNGLFNTKLPPELIEELKGNKKNEPSARLIHSIKLRWAWADMQSLKGIKEKAAFAKELLFG